MPLVVSLGPRILLLEEPSAFVAHNHCRRLTCRALAKPPGARHRNLTMIDYITNLIRSYGLTFVKVLAVLLCGGWLMGALRAEAGDALSNAIIVATVIVVAWIVRLDVRAAAAKRR